MKGTFLGPGSEGKIMPFGDSFGGLRAYGLGGISRFRGN